MSRLASAAKRAGYRRWAMATAASALPAALLAAFAVVGAGPPARAVPSFAQQTGLPCAACHVGAFGPQLKPYAREFKLFGYANGDGRNDLPPIAIVLLTSFTHTQQGQDDPPPHFGANDNLALDQLNAIYGGRLPGGGGAFAEVTYDGVRRTFTIDNLDVRRAIDPTFGAHDVVLGVDLNNRPTVQDLWNSTPTWGFPYNASAVAQTPAASTLLDGQLAQRVLGVGGYAMWDDTLYAELTGYFPVPNATLARLGVEEGPGADVFEGASPYWRLALQHEFAKRHYLEVGAFGMSTHRLPAGERAAGTDRISDAALDATYQFTGSDTQFVSAHATWIHERRDLGASAPLFGINRSDALDTIRADLSYSYKDTWTPSVQVFRTTGSVDPILYASPGGKPDSDGAIVELAYVPLGKPDAPISWANVRLTAQYVAYAKFDGMRRGASGHNTVFLSTRVALAPFGAFVRR